MINAICLSYPQTIPHSQSSEELSSKKSVPDAKKIGDCWPRDLGKVFGVVRLGLFPEKIGARMCVTEWAGSAFDVGGHHPVSWGAGQQETEEGETGLCPGASMHFSSPAFVHQNPRLTGLGVQDLHSPGSQTLRLGLSHINAFQGLQL